MDKHKKFMDWLDEKHHNPGQYVKSFEKIFSVTHETELLREIQDMKDELNMLEAVFTDQTAVLEKAGKRITEDRKRITQSKSSEAKDRAEMAEPNSSGFNFEEQSQKHSRHVERMKNQTSQAYDNVGAVHLG